ncbi:MAG: transketolase C-terminal domain-containing protein [Chloroflexota bacterium]|nr:transketolase C-terminal domain-containing protein [Chloroflexota bacterium]
MRDEFVNTFLQNAKDNSSLIFLTADLGFGAFDQLEKQLPNQYINVGVAEQNMIGVATGLSLEGFKVVAYSIGNFPTLRCLEQIRNDACYHETNITIVGMGGGFSYGPLGMSHHTTEDISIMRSLPGMKVLAPGTKKEAEFATSYLLNSHGVAYLRLDKSFAPNKKDFFYSDFKFGQAVVHRDGEDFAIFAMGGILEEALDASEKLAQKGIYCRVLSFHTIKPLDGEAIKKAIKETAGILTVEEHNLIGGLSSAVSEYCMLNQIHPKNFKSLALKDEYSSIVGSQKFLRKSYSLDSFTIVETINSLVNTFKNKI